MNRVNSFKRKIRKNFHKSAVFVIFVSLLSLTNLPSYAGTVSYVYDELGRVISVTQANGTTVTYQYDAAGNRTVVTTGGGGSGGGGGTNHAPTCITTPYTINIPPPGPVNFPVQAAMILAKCNDSDSDTLTVSSPATPYVVSIDRASTKQFQYTVSDGRGGAVTQTFTLKRM